MSSVKSLLGETLQKPDGSSVATDAALSGKSVLALYFSAHWCPPCRGFTPELCKKYTALTEAHKNFEMVFVSSDRDEAAFKDYHKSMTFLALPFAKRDEKEKLSKMFKVQGIPSLVFYDLDAGKVITTDGREEVSDEDFVKNFPYKPEAFSLSVLGDTLRKPGGEEVKSSDALSTDVLALYFSAHWCPPCRGFTPTLSEKYTALKGAGKSIEMVFVSSDRDEAAFNEYHDSMSFLALPYAEREAKNKLSKMFKVQGIPSLVFVDAKTGAIINGSGRGSISADTFLEDFPYHPKPMYDLAGSVDGINDEVCLLVLMETSPKDEQKQLSDMLMELAVEETKKEESDQIATRFFTGCGGGPVGKVRQLCGYPETSEVPVMLLMDFDNDGAHYHPLDEHKVVNKDNLKAFMRAFKDGKLTKRTPS